MIVVHDYHGFRIEIEAVADDGRWNANVRIRRILSSEWDEATWPTAKAELRRALALRRQLALQEIVPSVVVPHPDGEGRSIERGQAASAPSE